MDEDNHPKPEVMNASAPAPRKRPRYILPVLILVGLVLCAVFGVREVHKALSPCSYQPDSIRNPPMPPGAEQIAAGTYNATNAPPTFAESQGAYKVAHKEIHFETTDSPDEVYIFYSKSLSRDGWSNEEAYPGYNHLPGGVQRTPRSANATFHWGCGLEGIGIWAVDWFRAEVLASGKTRVSLNYEYIDDIP